MLLVSLRNTLAQQSDILSAWLFYVWLDSLITPVSVPNNPEYELCLPPFRVVRPGLIRLVLDVHGLSVSVLKDCYKL